MKLGHLLSSYRVGSKDWSWIKEYFDLIYQDGTRVLIESIRMEGIREPILLGDDGRVWDGHHRIVAAMYLGLEEVPVEWAGQS